MAIGLANFLADSHSRQQFLSASRRILQLSTAATLKLRRTLRTDGGFPPEILPLNTAEWLFVSPHPDGTECHSKEHLSHCRWWRSGNEEWIMRKLQCVVVGTALLLMSLNLLASTKKRRVGTVDFSGDPQFDADSISASGPNHWQWLSFPGGRLVLNPSPVDCSHIPPPLAKDIPLNLGGWVGTRDYQVTEHQPCACEYFSKHF